MFEKYSDFLTVFMFFLHLFNLLSILIDFFENCFDLLTALFNDFFEEIFGLFDRFLGLVWHFSNFLTICSFCFGNVFDLFTVFMTFVEEIFGLFVSFYDFFKIFQLFESLFDLKHHLLNFLNWIYYIEDNYLIFHPQKNLCYLKCFLPQ